MPITATHALALGNYIAKVVIVLKAVVDRLRA